MNLAIPVDVILVDSGTSGPLDAESVDSGTIVISTSPLH